MKKLLENKIVQIGVTAFFVIAACIVFYYCVINIPLLIRAIGGLITILMPLIFGLVLAYIMHPIVNIFENKVLAKVEKKTLRRNLSILCTLVVVIGVIAALISVVIPQLLESIQSLIINAPTYFKDLENVILNWLRNSSAEQSIVENYDTIVNYIINALNNVVSPMADSAIGKLSSGVFGVFSFVFNLVIGLVFAIYILANTSNFAAGMRKTLYSIFEVDKVNAFIDEIKHINKIFVNFMIGKICDSSIVACVTFLFLVIFKFPYPLLIAVIIGLTDLIPYFGPYIGTVPSALLICLVSPVRAITFVLFILVLQQIDGNLITPHIQKQATGLPSFWVLFAITLFGGLFGVVGLLIGVPCFTIIYELVTETIQKLLKKKNLPAETEYYMMIDGLEPKVIKAKKVLEK
ncbi:MAG: AI-2E family transporter [Bacilli bacterium]|nr:AI-2E family transporter [Bacilli bacterium]